MRILIAPDKFKGTLTQREACAAIRRGVERAARERGIAVDIDECPVADGGEGTQEVISLHADPVVESASVIGLSRIPVEHRDPAGISTEPLGREIAAMLAKQPARLLIALGGSATVDGGIGVAAACGYVFRDARGDRLPPIGRSLPDIRSIAHPADSRSSACPSVTALCDVQNPLLGPRGAARQFGPQKGATPDQVERLERGLENLVHVCRECGIPCDPDQPGAGAAGGLGFGLATFLGAKLVPGAPFILDLLNFDERCAAADLVITGEGKMDMQTAEGKACAEVAKLAAKAGKPCIAVVGTTEEPPEVLKKRLTESGVVFETILATSGGAEAAAALEYAAFVAVCDRLR